MFLELTAAHAKTKKLETELASVETQVGGVTAAFKPLRDMPL